VGFIDTLFALIITILVIPGLTDFIGDAFTGLGA
jgi:hypothetical protein